jgi:peroxidase
VPRNQAAFNPTVLASGIAAPLKFLASDLASELDTSIVSSVRNVVYGTFAVSDAAAASIQRGRDHGLPNYNAVRVAYGLPAYTQFSQITGNPALQAALTQLYGGINRIDVWAGAMAEDHVPNTSTGQLLRAMFIDQLTRLRDGDRFFYKIQFLQSSQATLESGQLLADIIRRNTAADVLQDNVFFFRVSVSGEVFEDIDGGGEHDPGERGLRNRTVQLFAVENGQAVLRASALPDANGRYSFSVFDGLTTGEFQVQELVPAGWALTSANPRTAQLPRGETFLDVDFGNVRSGPSNPQQ